MLTLMNADGQGREVIDKYAEGDMLRLSPYCCGVVGRWSAGGGLAQRVGAGERMTTFLAVFDVETRQVRQLAQLRHEGRRPADGQLVAR